MSSILVRNTVNRGRINNYLIGGNVCNAFAMGILGSVDDFFLIAAEPLGESNFPMLTGNILDSEGAVLCRIVQNMLVSNPGKCSKILSDTVVTKQSALSPARRWNAVDTLSTNFPPASLIS